MVAVRVIVGPHKIHNRTHSVRDPLERLHSQEA